MIADIIVLAVLLISAAISFMRGLIRETLTILGVVGGLVAAYLGGPVLTPHVRGWMGVVDGEEPERLFNIIPYTLLADALSYGGIFIAVVVILSFASHLLAETVRSIGLGSIDRTLGVIFGLARGVILLGLLYLPFHYILGEEQKEEYFKDSKSLFYLEQTAEIIAGLLPDTTIEQLENDARKMSEGIDAQQRLQELTGQGQPGAPAEDGAPQPTTPAGQQQPGYTDDFRERMDTLFEEKTQDPSGSQEP